jgi:hypothetical protein
MKPMVLAVLLALVSIAYAGDPVDPVLDRLAKVERFAFGGTGYAGVISQGEKDYKLVLARASAKADFERLLAIGNPQAKSYALVGLRKLDRSRFEQISKSFRDSTEEVVTQTGCIVSHETLGIILKRIDAGDYSAYWGIERR